MGGGSRQKEVIYPEFAETLVQQGVGMGRDVATQQATYIPGFGPTVASLTPQDKAVMQSTDAMASAFGLPSTGGQSYLPEEQIFDGGIRGYSSAPLEQQIVSQIQDAYPGFAEYTESFGIDPVTGEVGMRSPEMQPVELEMQGSGGRK
tara:strand:- start:6757 stop:7200 length:444 start_codon:yes stop_codon:yes gene_type:complete